MKLAFVWDWAKGSLVMVLGNYVQSIIGNVKRGTIDFGYGMLY